MQLTILANDRQRKELEANSLPDSSEILWLDTLNLDAVDRNHPLIDLLYQPSHATALRGFDIVFVNSVTETLDALPQQCVRINGWNGFLQSKLWEAAALPSLQEKAEQILTHLNKTVEWVADQPGFVSARVISMIINEAYIALEEGVSSREEIDIAMKTGTNYPLGPFEWGELIGEENVLKLLQAMSLKNSRYQPAKAMLKKIGS